MPVVAVDTETTGLDIYSDTFACRLVQFGTQDEAWVVPVELSLVFEGAVLDALRSIDKIVMLSPNQAQVLFTMKVAPSGRLPRGSGPKNNEFQAVAQLLVQPRETLVCSYLPRPADSL